MTASEVVRWLAGQVTLRDIAIVEPDIEEVVTRLYRDRDPGDGPPAGQECSITSTRVVPGASASYRCGTSPGNRA